MGWPQLSHGVSTASALAALFTRELCGVPKLCLNCELRLAGDVAALCRYHLGTPGHCSHTACPASLPQDPRWAGGDSGKISACCYSLNWAFPPLGQGALNSESWDEVHKLGTCFRSPSLCSSCLSLKAAEFAGAQEWLFLSVSGRLLGNAVCREAAPKSYA